MQNRQRGKKRFKLLGIVGLILTVPYFAFAQYLNEVNETPLQFENTLTYNLDGEYLTSINVLSDSNWVNHGWNVLQFKQYDSAFNVINETRFQDSLHVFQQGGRILFFQNEYYFSGFYRDLYLQGNDSAYVVKYNQNGDLVWFNTYYDSIPNTRIAYLLEKNERLYIGGYFNYDSVVIQHSFVSEIDTAGNILWTKIFDDFNPVTIANLRATTDGLLLSCRYGTGGTNKRVILYKLDFEGNTQWQKTYGLTASWLGNNFAPIELPNGQLLLYGVQSHPQTEQSGSWLLLTDSQGNVIKDSAYHFSQLIDYFQLYYSPPIIRENDFLLLGYIRESGTSPRNAYLACIDFDFNVKWKRIYGEREVQNRLTFLHDLGNDFYLLSGVVDDDADHPTTDEWFVVVDSMGCDVTDCYLGLEEENTETVSFSVYPNPTSDNFTIELKGNYNTSKMHYKLMDLTGKKVQEGNLMNSKLDVSNLDNGVYYLRLEQNGIYFEGKKVVIE